jgi:threonyl-tRNA synthetase
MRALESAIRKRCQNDGFEEVRSPQLVRRPIWESSGHWQNFREHMFVFGEHGREEALKPVNCPCHIQIVERRAPSYRDLPIRLAELGVVHRAEDSGVLNGLFRLRQFTQDDGHVFCLPEHIEDEIASVCYSLRAIYRVFGFEGVDVFFSSRPAVRAGDDAVWDRAEAVLRRAAHAAGLDPLEQPGQGAFYGPKLEWALRDRLGRSWQCGTVQLDLIMPERFGLSYVDANGARARPAMIHRAIFGSLERFCAILLEHHDGVLPAWLAPVQVAVVPIADAQAAFAREVRDRLRAHGLRAESMGGGVTLSRALVDVRNAAIPLVAVIGKREVESRSVALGARGGDRRELSLDDAIAECRRQCAES